MYTNIFKNNVKILIYSSIQKCLFHVATIFLLGLFQEIATYKGIEFLRWAANSFINKTFKISSALLKMKKKQSLSFGNCNDSLTFPLPFLPFHMYICIYTHVHTHINVPAKHMPACFMHTFLCATAQARGLATVEPGTNQPAMPLPTLCFFPSKSHEMSL